ncbi:hypothetical protein BDQ17DRAFT_1419999 [Cyathus striatus]|nr:hypothetical protein BDQ17DRAFT_1419999 [Cyathus striatus]
MPASVASSTAAAVAGQLQYTSQETDISAERAANFEQSQSQNMDEDLLYIEKTFEDGAPRTPRTPGLCWESDTSSDSSPSPNLKSVFEDDWDDSFPAPTSTSDVITDETGAQIVALLSDNAFYEPHPPPRPFGYSPFSDPTFPNNFPETSEQKDALFRAWALDTNAYEIHEPVKLPLAKETVIVVNFSETPAELEEELSLDLETGWYSPKHAGEEFTGFWPVGDKHEPDVPRDVQVTRVHTL